MIFFIDKSIPVVLYGAATIGTIFYRKYNEWNLNITAFIDKRAEEIKSFIGLPVYSIDNDVLDKKNVVVIIAVKNVFEHSRIASKLQKSGYKKIIYRPYNALNNNGSEQEILLNDIYSHITEDYIFDEKLYAEIPFVEASNSLKLIENGVITKNKGKVTFYLPITMIFKDKKDPELEIQHSILCLKPHYNFARYIIGNGGEINSLLKYCIEEAEKMQTVKVTEAWKENVIANQSEIYLDMLHKYNVEPEFFINKAPNVIWNNERKYFNLNSGKHRASFMCAMGKNYIPVCASEEDYKKYLEAIDVESMQKKISAQFEDGLSYPVENPYFYNYSRYDEQFWFLLVRAITEKLSEWYYDNGKILKGLKVYYSLTNCDFLETFLVRVGASLQKKVDTDSNEKYDVAFVEDFDDAENIHAEHTLILSEKSFDKKNCLLEALQNGKCRYLYELEVCA